MKVIVGLGDPGREYEGTPHNAGFAVVDELAGRMSCSLGRSWRFNVRSGSARLGDDSLLLVEPRTYMNNSGLAVASVMAYRKVAPSDLIVVSDDADLDIGRIRVRRKGSAGGHKGLISIIRALGTEDFVRVRVGIGRGGEGRDLVAHVLTPITGDERRQLADGVDRAADAVLAILERGVEHAMNDFNSRDSKPGAKAE